MFKKCWRNGKQGNPWSDCSSRSSLIWVYSVRLDLLVQKLGSLWYSFLFSERVKFAHNYGRSKANQDGYQGGGDWERSDWDCRLYWNNNVLIRYTLTTFVFYASSYITSTIHNSLLLWWSKGKSMGIEFWKLFEQDLANHYEDLLESFKTNRLWGANRPCCTIRGSFGGYD